MYTCQVNSCPIIYLLLNTASSFLKRSSHVLINYSMPGVLSILHAFSHSPLTILLGINFILILILLKTESLLLLSHFTENLKIVNNLPKAQELVNGRPNLFYF